MYKIRTDRGTLVAKVSNKIALKMIDDIKGHFRPYETVCELKCICFEIDEDTSYGTNDIQICIWKGFKLIPCEE